MPLYIVANEHGEIIKSGSSSSHDISIQAKERQFSMFMLNLSREDDARGVDARKYVTFDEHGPTIADRPAFDVPDSFHCSVGGSILVPNLPEGTIVTVDHVPTSVEAGTLELVFPCVGDIELSLRSFPHVPKTIRVVVS